jgi:dienelactone hydrolase
MKTRLVMLLSLIVLAVFGMGNIAFGQVEVNKKGPVTTVAADNIVTFKGTDTTKEGAPLTLSGKLTKPQSDGPFPAIIMLHSCDGINKRDTQWVGRLASWGYVVLQVDSLGPRGISGTSVCDDTTLMIDMIQKRAQDAYDGKSYLNGLSFVDQKRIAVMGWSHGGMTTLSVIGQKRDDPFRSAIAFYPYCYQLLFNHNAPLLILIGEKDDWTPDYACSTQMRPAQTGPEVILKIYPNATHAFDWEGMDRSYSGHRLLYNPVATSDAIIQVKAFLTKHLK